MERSTRQRQAIREVLLELDRPLSPQEVLDAAQSKVPGAGHRHRVPHPQRAGRRGGRRSRRASGQPAALWTLGQNPPPPLPLHRLRQSFWTRGGLHLRFLGNGSARVSNSGARNRTVRALCRLSLSVKKHRKSRVAGRRAKAGNPAGPLLAVGRRPKQGLRPRTCDPRQRRCGQP